MKLRVNGIDIHYTIEGEGPVVTLSHSLGCNLSMWDEQAQALKPRYRVLRSDTRGHGGTSAPGGRYRLEQMVEDLHGLLTVLDIAQTHFVGLSMGGMIGQLFALQYPEMTQSLALCDTTSRWPKDARPLWQERIRTVQAGGMEPMVEPTIERWFTMSFREQHRDVTNRVRDMLRTTPPNGYIGCCHAIPRIDVTDRLNAISCPTLVIVGEQDPATPVEMARAIHAAIAGAELIVLQTASHLSNIEQPERFNQAVVGFLDRVARQS